jgi:hypothetical protein
MGRNGSQRGQRQRVSIAQTAARLIAEHGLTDWSAAKRKACRELGLPENETLPGNDEVEQALRDYNSLFRADGQAALLRRQREVALGWMGRLAAWRPVLIGGAAAGWATAYSDVRLELEAEDPKAVELALINAGIDYAAGDAGDPPSAHLVAGRGEQTIRLQVLTPLQRRNRQRRDDDARLTQGELLALLADADAADTPR